MNKNQFALRPPMGWNSYDYYDTNVKEHEVLANAEFMARHLKPYGWEYVVVDIQWYAYNTASMRDKFQYIPFEKMRWTNTEGCCQEALLINRFNAPGSSGALLCLDKGRSGMVK